MIQNSFELQPTLENIRDTYLKDSIGRNVYLHRFIDLLNFIDGPCSIALDADWGSGKTFLVKQTKMILEEHNPFCVSTEYEADDIQRIKAVWSKSHTGENDSAMLLFPIYFDAWKNDYHTSPLLALIYEILKTVNLQNDLTKYDMQVKPLVAGVIKCLTAGVIDIKEILSALEKTDFFEALKKEKELHILIQELLGILLPGKGERLVVFIDELDRCRPDFAVRLLEQIKHYCANEKIIFVFSTNMKELQHTIKKFYGADFDADRYLDRFFDLRSALPNPDLNRYYQSLGVEVRGAEYYDAGIVAISRHFGFSLRETAKFARLVHIAVYKPTHAERSVFHLGMHICFYLILPFMIALKLYNTTQYYKFVQGRDSQSLLDFVKSNPDYCYPLCSALLDDNETFGGQNGMKKVSCCDKVQKLYERLFTQDELDDIPYGCTIGRCQFYRSYNSSIREMENLLSSYTDYGNGIK